MPNIKAECAACKQEFLIIELEQGLLKKLDLPHPSECNFCRKKNRHHLRQRGRFYKINCKKCNKEIHTTCDPETDLMIYCKECYLEFRGSGDSDKIYLDLD